MPNNGLLKLLYLANRMLDLLDRETSASPVKSGSLVRTREYCMIARAVAIPISAPSSRVVASGLQSRCDFVVGMEPGCSTMTN